MRNAFYTTFPALLSVALREAQLQSRLDNYPHDLLSVQRMARRKAALEGRPTKKGSNTQH
jgi:hypothetical protein